MTDLNPEPARAADLIRRVFNLVDELCAAVDAAGDDVGGHRGSLLILRELGPASYRARALLPAIRALPSAPAAQDGGWRVLNTDHSVRPWEAELLLLWHPLWERGVTAGYYHEPTDQWRGLSDEGWFALGIPPSHYCLPAPPAGDEA